MQNFITLSITRKGGDTVTAFDQLFDPSRMVDIKLSTTAGFTGISFLYPSGPNGDLTQFESTSLTTVAGIAALVNLAAPSGTQTYVGVFDPSANSSQRAIGSHNFLDANGNSLIIPDNSRVWDGYYEVITTFSSAGADAGTIALSIATDDVAGLKAAIAISDGANPWDAAAPAALIQVGTIAAISEKTTAARAIQAVVAGQVLTAGKMYIYIEVVTVPS